jgi:hypothetical protein
MSNCTSGSCPVTPSVRGEDMHPCVLPSATSACELASGDWRALPKAALHTAGRSALAAVGIFAAGERSPAKLAKYSVGVALAIEAFAISWARWRMR